MINATQKNDKLNSSLLSIQITFMLNLFIYVKFMFYTLISLVV
jgi:hypothetical protein